ncbi:MAG TPA: methylated-DNA--[protein]-cysteine S-methyltransferase [Candidatus Baltobacteraceae bacterium]
MELISNHIATPLGIALRLVSNGSAIVESDFVRGKPRARTRVSRDALLTEASIQVAAYFRKRLDRFDLPLALAGTPFQLAVWRLVSQLEVGELISYGDIARAIGHPLAHRGVAAAMGKSPLDLLIPAHRVIGADGRVKGSAAGSLRRRLLAFEGIRIR